MTVFQNGDRIIINTPRSIFHRMNGYIIKYPVSYSYIINSSQYRTNYIAWVVLDPSIIQINNPLDKYYSIHITPEDVSRQISDYYGQEHDTGIIRYLQYHTDFLEHADLYINTCDKCNLSQHNCICKYVKTIMKYS